MIRAKQIIQQHLDQASRQWRWLRFLRHSATLGIIVTSIVLLLGVVIVCGWLTSGGFVTGCLVFLVAAAILTLAFLALIVTTSRPERDELARAIERAHPALMDRLNTLVFLGRLKGTPGIRSYYRRIEGQTHSTLAGQVPTSRFSSARPVARLCALAALVMLTAWFYFQFRPLTTLTAASAQLHGDEEKLEETFEIPPPEPEPEPASPKETALWGEVRITDPGRDLTVTGLENIPLHIEASASEPVKNVEWYTSINGGDEKKRPLPIPDDPRYAVYDPVIELKKLGLSDWDVVEYYAKATSERADSFVSETYFVKIQPFREELRQLPGGQEGECYSVLNQMSGLIERQQQVIREAHRQQYSPDTMPETQDREPERLAEIEDEIATSTAHLGARIAGEFGEKAVAKPLSHLDRAQESLGSAAEAFRQRSLSEAQPQARASLAEMVEARKQLQKNIDGNPRAFAARDEGDSNSESESAESLKKISEFCDKSKAAVEFVRELAERQRGIAEGAGLGKVSHRTTFTTGLDSRNRPMDSIKEISMREEKVYMYTSWRGLSQGEHKHVCKMFDGAGRIVAQPQMNFEANPRLCNTWSWHDFDQSRDKPGTWKFEIYVDGQKVIEENLRVLSANEAVRYRPARRTNSEPFRSLEQNSIFSRLADEEDGLYQEFAEFEKQHSDVFRDVQTESEAAKDGLQQASDSLRNKRKDSQQLTASAAKELDRLAEALTQQTSAQQLANAYKLKSMLDEQVKLLERLEQDPNAMTAQELEEACQNMKKVTSGLKRTAEEKPTSESFAQKLRESLNDENKRNLDSLCDSLCSAKEGEARKQAAGAAKSGLQKVSQAFTESQPQLLAELQKEDALQPAGKRSLDRGIKQLEDLLASGRDGRRLSTEDTKKLEQEALTNIEKGIEDLDSASGASGKTYKALRESYAPGVTVDPRVIQQLITQLENLSVELVETQGAGPGEPEIRYVDPEKLPQAYRERIGKYYEKLSGQQ